MSSGFAPFAAAKRSTASASCSPRTSAATFSVGATMPLLMVVVSPANALVPIASAASLGFPALLGAVGANRRCRRVARYRSCDILGCSGDGTHRRDRKLLVPLSEVLNLARWTGKLSQR